MNRSFTPSHNLSFSLSDARNQVSPMITMSTDLSSSPDVRNVSDDRIYPQISRRRETFETTEDGDVVIVRSSFDDDGGVKQYTRLPPKQQVDWQSRSPQQEDGKDGGSERRNPSSPLDTHHTRNLSSHFFDATTIARSGSLDSSDMYKDDELSDQSRKHRRLMSNGSFPGVAHRRLNSKGNAAHIDRRHFHQREHSAGLDILSAAVDASKDELAQAAGEQRVDEPTTTTWEQQQLTSHPMYDSRPYQPLHSSSHHMPVTHSMQPPHSRRFTAPPSGSYMHGALPGRGGPVYHVPYSGYAPPVYYSPGYPPRHGYGVHEYPSQHSVYPSKATTGVRYPPETRLRPNETGASILTSHSAPAEQPWANSDSDPTVASAGGHQVVSQSYSLGRPVVPTPSSSKRHSHPTTRSGPEVTSRPAHHRKMSSFSSIGLGTVFGRSVTSPNGENETHPLLCLPVSKQRSHHRSTSSTVSFMNVLDVAGMVGTADETFLRNLQASNDTDFRTPTPSDTNMNVSTGSSALMSDTNPDSPPGKLAAGGSNKRIRRKCTISGCVNRVVQGGLCISHGAKRKICGHPGCNKNVKKAGMCSTHGPARKRCETLNCQKVAVQGGMCISHGAKKRLCDVDNCNKQAILGGMCKKHHDRGKGIVTGGSDDNDDSSEASEASHVRNIPPLSSSPSSSSSHKPSHTRGLSIFHDISADAVQSLLNAETVPDTAAAVAAAMPPTNNNNKINKLHRSRQLFRTQGAVTGSGMSTARSLHAAKTTLRRTLNGIRRGEQRRLLPVLLLPYSSSSLSSSCSCSYSSAWICDPNTTVPHPHASWTSRFHHSTRRVGRAAAAAAAAAASTAAVVTAALTTDCEASTIDHHPTIESHKEADTDDPYANLPEEDEATDCSMCRTFREGPCRPYWRKLERCFKDHATPQSSSAATSATATAADKEANTDGHTNHDEDESSSIGSQCVRYFSPHQECLSRYINLYQLIDLQQTKQALAEDTEQAMRPDERQWWSSDVNNNNDDDDDGTRGGSGSLRLAPSIDFAPYIEFRNELGPSFRQTIPLPLDDTSSSQPTRLRQPLPPLWKRLPDAVEPVLIATRCTVPMMMLHTKNNANTKDESSSPQVVKFAYAVDQDGFVIGLGYNSYYADLLDQAQRQAATTTTTRDTSTRSTTTTTTTTSPPLTTTTNPTNDSSEPSESIHAPSHTFDFTFYILPGETQTVRIVGLYFESPLTAPPNKTILDATMYTTRTAYDLETV